MNIKKRYHQYGNTARVGFTRNNIEVVIYTDDPDINPHFHFINRNDNDNEGCISIIKPEYVKYDNMNLRLNDNQIDELIEFLESKHNIKRYNYTNWEFLLQMWNDNNDDEIDEDMEMPDYKLLR